MIEKKTKTGLMMAMLGLLLMGILVFIWPIIMGAQAGPGGIGIVLAGPWMGILPLIGGILAFVFGLIGLLFVAKAAVEPTPIAPPAPAPMPGPAPMPTPAPAPMYSPPPAQPYPQYPPGQYPPPSPP